MKKFFATIFLLIFCISLSGCNEIGTTAESLSKPVPVDYPFEIDGVTFDNAPKTIASLSPALTEIIYELGYGDKLIGRSSYCDYPDGVKEKTVIGSSANPDINEIIKLNPEVLVSQSPIANKDVVKINKAGIKVLILPNPSNFSQLKNYYTQIAMLFDGASKAKEKAEITLLPLTDELHKAKKIGSFVYIMTNDLAAGTGDTLSGEILSYFGDNIAANNANYTVPIEELTAKQPDILFISSQVNKDALLKQLDALNCVQHGKLIVIENTSFERPTSRCLTELVKDIETKCAGFEQVTETPAESETAVTTQNGQ